MKVLMVDDYGYKIGGAEVYMYALKTQLELQGHEVKVLASFNGASNDTDFTFRPVNPSSPLRFVMYVYNVFSQRAIRQAIQAYRPDVVHIHSFFYHCSPSILFGLKGVPTVITLHSDDLIAPYSEPQQHCTKHDLPGYCAECIGRTRFWLEKLKRLVLSVGLKRVVRYIAPSRYIEKLYAEHNYATDKLLQLNNGVPAPDAFKATSSGKKDIVWVGRISPEKGAEVAVRAMGILIANRPESTLHIVGDGPDKARLVKLARSLGLEGRVVFRGRLDSRDSFQALQQAAVCVIPSLWNECFSLVAVEAMQAGTPIIVSNIGGLPERVVEGKNGFLFPPGDYEQLATLLDRVLSDDSLRHAMSDEAQAMARDYSMEKHTQSIMNIYKEMQRKAKA